jgi:endoglucanase Acf2
MLCEVLVVCLRNVWNLKVQTFSGAWFSTFQPLISSPMTSPQYMRIYVGRLILDSRNGDTWSSPYSVWMRFPSSFVYLIAFSNGPLDILCIFC